MSGRQGRKKTKFTWEHMVKADDLTACGIDKGVGGDRRACKAAMHQPDSPSVEQGDELLLKVELKPIINTAMNTTVSQGQGLRGQSPIVRSFTDLHIGCRK